MQSTESAVPPAQWVPAEHAAQLTGVVSLPGAVCTVPAPHAPAGRQLEAFTVEVYVPAAHGAQTRSSVADGSPLT